MTDSRTATALPPVLADLADLVGAVGPERFGDPTPCPDFDVATLRTHLLAWVTVFAAALDDPEGTTERPDPDAFSAPGEPAAAADLVRDATARVERAVAAGVGDRTVQLTSWSVPGEQAMAMMLAEVVAHGSDLARAVGQPWNPPESASEAALHSMEGMLTDEFRGEGKSFGPRVEVSPDAPALDRLLAFSGRDPYRRG